MKTLRLSSKTGLIIFFIGLIPAFSVLGFYYFDHQRYSLHSVKQILKFEKLTFEQKISRKISNFRKSAREFSENSSLKKSVKNIVRYFPKNYEKMYDEIYINSEKSGSSFPSYYLAYKKVLKKHSEELQNNSWDSFTFLDPESGNIIFESSEEFEQFNRNDKFSEVFTEILNREEDVLLYQNTEKHGHESLYFLVPIIENGKTLAILMLKKNVGNLVEILSDKNYLILENNFQSISGNGINLEKMTFRPNYEDHGDNIYYQDFNNVGHYLYIGPLQIKGLNWYFLVNRNENKFETPPLFNIPLISIVLLNVFILALVSYFAPKYFLNRINNISQKLNKVSEGNLEFDIKKSQDDEIGAVEKALGKLVENLKNCFGSSLINWDQLTELKQREIHALKKAEEETKLAKKAVALAEKEKAQAKLARDMAELEKAKTATALEDTIWARKEAQKATENVKLEKEKVDIQSRIAQEEKIRAEEATTLAQIEKRRAEEANIEAQAAMLKTKKSSELANKERLKAEEAKVRAERATELANQERLKAEMAQRGAFQEKVRTENALKKAEAEKRRAKEALEMAEKEREKTNEALKKSEEEIHKAEVATNLAIKEQQKSEDLALSIKVTAEDQKRKVNHILEVVKSIEQGDFGRQIEIEGDNAIGQLAAGLSHFFDVFRKNILEIGNNAALIKNSSKDLAEVSEFMNTNASGTLKKTESVLDTSQKIQNNMHIVSRNASDVTKRFNSVDAQTTDASKLSHDAVTLTNEVESVVKKLGDNSDEIVKFIKSINSIAHQTNLLSLNATIEAARAGEAGKGFSVVANEVKELANETAMATSEINAIVENIKESTQNTVEVITKITHINRDINVKSQEISKSVKIQVDAMGNIAQEINEASKGVEQITRNIGEVEKAAKTTSNATKKTSNQSINLNKVSHKLNDLVAQYFIVGDSNDLDDAA